MYNLHTNRTYAYYKILIEPKKKTTAIKSKQHVYIWVCKTCLDLKNTGKKNECVKSPPHAVIYFLQLRQKVSLIASAYSLYRHRSLLDLALNY